MKGRACFSVQGRALVAQVARQFVILSGFLWLYRSSEWFLFAMGAYVVSFRIDRLTYQYGDRWRTRVWDGLVPGESGHVQCLRLETRVCCCQWQKDWILRRQSAREHSLSVHCLHSLGGFGVFEVADLGVQTLNLVHETCFSIEGGAPCLLERF